MSKTATTTVRSNGGPSPPVDAIAPTPTSSIVAAANPTAAAALPTPSSGTAPFPVSCGPPLLQKPKQISNRAPFVFKGMVYPPGLSRKIYRCVVVHQEEGGGEGDEEVVVPASTDTTTATTTTVSNSVVGGQEEDLLQAKEEEETTAAAAVVVRESNGHPLLHQSHWKTVIEEKGGSFQAPDGTPDGEISLDVYLSLRATRTQE